MRVLYDHQIFNYQVYGGVSRYFFELMNQFEKDSDVNFELAIRYSDNHYLESADLADYKSFLGGFRFRGRNRIMRFFNERRSRKSLIKQDFDIFHPTFYDTYFLDYLGSKPFVLTIYDMIQEVMSWRFSFKDKYVNNKKILAQKAAVIIAISENTKRDIIKYYDISENKIKVVYLGSSLTSARAKNTPVPERYVLFVGSRSIYKNFEFFIKAVRGLMAEDKSLYIVCSGGSPFSAYEKQIISGLGLEGRVCRFAATDEVLA